MADTTLVPGREMDALIDEKVFGYTWRAIEPGDIAPPTVTHRLCMQAGLSFHVRAERHADGRVVVSGGRVHSTDNGAAMFVVETLRERGIYIDFQSAALGYLTIAGWEGGDGDDIWKVTDTFLSPTAAFGICRAALAAVEAHASRLHRTQTSEL